ncbi:MAG: PDZ domain-containing protein [candidate division WOR-3 bacterium]|nr:PDZ domain-containing protein [candidate division WOR-3 bacterium]
MKTIILLMTLFIPLSMHGNEDTVGYLGLSTQNLSEAMKIAFDVDYGLLVDRIYEGSPAEEGGMNVGDIIQKIDGNEIRDYKTLRKIVRENPSKRVTVSLLRKGKQISKTVTLGAKEKSRISINIDIPEIPDLQVILGTKELQDNIAELRVELDELKRELEEIKEQLR